MRKLEWELECVEYCDGLEDVEWNECGPKDEDAGMGELDDEGEEWIGEAHEDVE